MRLQQLYNTVFDNNINIVYAKTCNKKAFASLYADSHYVVLDISRISTEKEEAMLLAEEIGHCVSDSFYHLQSSYSRLQKINIDKAECRATKWAIRELVPLADLKCALTQTKDIFELADIFDVDDSYIVKAIEMYRNKNEIN